MFLRKYQGKLQDAFRKWKRQATHEMRLQRRQLEITQDIFMDELNQSMEVSRKLEDDHLLQQIRRAKCSSCLNDLMLTASDEYNDNESGRSRDHLNFAPERNTKTRGTTTVLDSSSKDVNSKTYSRHSRGQSQGIFNDDSEAALHYD